MSLKLGVDLDVDLFFSRLDKTLKDRDKALQEYLTRPHADARQLFNVVNGASSPVVIDLGAPGGGLLWSVQQVCCMAGNVLSTTAAANVAAGVFVGGIPTGISAGIDTASLVATGLVVPFNYQAGGKSLIARQGQHIYIVLVGSGTGANQWSATASVLQTIDSPQALLWL